MCKEIVERVAINVTSKFEMGIGRYPVIFVHFMFHLMKSYPYLLLDNAYESRLGFTLVFITTWF